MREGHANRDFYYFNSDLYHVSSFLPLNNLSVKCIIYIFVYIYIMLQNRILTLNNIDFLNSYLLTIAHHVQRTYPLTCVCGVWWFLQNTPNSGKTWKIGLTSFRYTPLRHIKLAIPLSVQQVLLIDRTKYDCPTTVFTRNVPYFSAQSRLTQIKYILSEARSVLVFWLFYLFIYFFCCDSKTQFWIKRVLKPLT